VKSAGVKGTKPRDLLPRNLAFWVGAVAWAVFLLTLSPGVSWEHHSEDSGDLITAAWVLGIPHPTGYPLFTMLGWIWSHLVALGPVAWRMNAFSALWGAMAAGVTVRATWSSFHLLSEEIRGRITRGGMAVAACASGLLLAFATDVWSLSVVTEVYTMALFFTSLVSWLLIELLNLSNMEDQSDEDSSKRRTRLIILLGLAWGFSLTNHMTSLFLLPGILLVLIFGGIRPTAKDIVKGVLFFILPLFLYLYLPIRSMMNPPLDWGNPETFHNFIWVVTGQQFRKLMFTLFPYQMLHQVMRYSSVPLELAIPGALAAGLGIIRLLLGRSRSVILLMVYGLTLVASSLFYLASYFIWDPEGYLLPMIWAVSMWAGWSIVLLTGVPEPLVKTGRIVAILLLVIAPVAGLVGHWTEVDLSGNYEAMRFGQESFESLEPDALMLEMRYERAFTLWYYREVEYADARDDVAIVFVEHATFEWGLALLRRKYPDLVLPAEPISRPRPQSGSSSIISIGGRSTQARLSMSLSMRVTGSRLSD
jgi:hypothetical protein